MSGRELRRLTPNADYPPGRLDGPGRAHGQVAARELTDAYDRAESLPDPEPFYEGEGFRLIADEREQHDEVGGARTFAGLTALRNSSEQVLHYTTRDRAEKWR